MPHVYFDDQTRRLLEQYKSENQNFNLSQFVQKMVKEYSYENEKIDIGKVTHEIENIDLEIKRLEEKKRYLSEKKQVALKQQKDNLDKSKEEREGLINTALKYLKVTEKEAEDLVDEYLPINHAMSLSKFAIEKGVASK